MKKNFIKLTAQTILVALSFTVIPHINVNAAEYNESNVTQDTIEKVTGTDNLSSNLTKSEDYIAIADGTNSTVKIPESSSNAILVNPAYNENESFGIHLPKESIDSNSKLSENGTVVYTNNSSTSFGVQAMNNKGIEGVRSLIDIKDSSAPKEYTFTFDLSKGTKLVTDEDFLGKEFSSGEIYIVNEQNAIVGTVDKPWAYDANGKAVSTHYKIENGNTLVQVVEFTKDTAFPVVADPSAWQITKCVGSIAWAIGSGVFAAAKILKIKKYIAALGGMREAAALLLGATTWQEKMNAGGTALVNLAAEISGINGIKENCFS